MTVIKDDQYFMRHAMQLAEMAAQQNEVPVGAVVVLKNEIIGEGYNRSLTDNDPTAHAEIVAMRAATKALNNYRLNDATLYVTLEPCLMCAGAMVHARVKRLVFGALDSKAGAVVSCECVLQKPFLNHRIDFLGSVLNIECGALLSQFFQARRAQLKQPSAKNDQSLSSSE